MAGKRSQFSAEGLNSRLLNLKSGRDEMNLCELPFATLSERSNGRDTMYFEVEEFDRSIGQTILRSLTVKGDPEFGLPTEKDEEIYLGLLKYSNDFNGLSSPEIRLTRATLFELMDWPRSDWAYARLTKGLHRLVGVRLSYQNLWRDNSNKQWRDQGAFGILDSFQLRDSRTVGSSSSFSEHTSVIRWSSVLFNSFDSGYLKRIDYGLVRELSATPRRLYRYLDKHFFPPHKRQIKIDLARLAYEHVGVSRSTKLDKVRTRFIAPAIEELESAGYLKPNGNNGFEKVRRGVWNAMFELACQDGRKRETVGREDLLLLTELGRRGVSEAAARSFLTRFQSAQIQQAIRAMDEQKAAGSSIRAPERWITAALRDGYRSSPAVEQSRLRPERKIFRASTDSE